MAIHERRLAMLIDGDNAQYSLLKQIFEAGSKYGEITIRRAYGDWTKPQLANWQPIIHQYAIQPIQQFRYTTGKNATDSALIIDAMDILYSSAVQGFCIVSSDSDYTQLCIRIQEAGLFVMGIGKQGTPKAFVNACTEFVYVEALAPKPVKTKPAEPVKKATATPPVKAPAAAKTTDKTKPNNTQQALLDLLRRAFAEAVQDNDGWVHLGTFGSVLQSIEPNFDSRMYGFKTLSLLVKSLPKHIEVKAVDGASASSVYVRLKKK